MAKYKMLIELKVNSDLFKELPEYTAMAVNDGWGDDPENGVYYFAQEICDEYSRFMSGISLEIIP